MKSYLNLILLAGLLGLAISCSDKEEDPVKDGGVNPQADLVVAVDQALAPDQSTATPDQGIDQPLTSYKVAAVQYSEDNYTAVPGCTDDLCGLTHFITEAADAGSRLVVTAEYTLGKYQTETSPAVGDTPATDSRWAAGTIIKTLAQLADDKNIVLSFNLLTDDGVNAYNTMVVVDGEGKVVARHYKFQLFGSEGSALAAGTSVANSFFETPMGKTGVVICADVQCIITGMQPSPDCAQESIELLQEFFMVQKPKMVLLSSMWTVGGTGMWAALNVQQQIAKDGNVYVVAANTTAGQGRGGGIYAPGGAVLQQVSSSTPSVVYEDLPLQ